MATKTFKVCDRCDAQFERDNNSNEYPVQDVRYTIPTSIHLHTVDYSKPTTKELCLPCRRELSNRMTDFMAGPG